MSYGGPCHCCSQDDVDTVLIRRKWWCLWCWINIFGWNLR